MSEKIVIDLSNYRDRMGQRVPDGDYTVVVADVEQDESRAGNVMINLWLDVVEGEFKDSTIMDRLTMTEKAMFRVVNFMRAIGMPTPKKRIELDIRALVGQILVITVEDGEPYNGVIKSEVRGYSPSNLNKKGGGGGGSDLEDLDDEEDYADEEDEDEDEEVEPEPEPVRKVVKRKKKAAPKPEPEPAEGDDEDDDEDEEIDLDELEL